MTNVTLPSMDELAEAGLTGKRNIPVTDFAHRNGVGHCQNTSGDKPFEAASAVLTRNAANDGWLMQYGGEQNPKFASVWPDIQSAGVIPVFQNLEDGHFGIARLPHMDNEGYLTYNGNIAFYPSDACDTSMRDAVILALDSKVLPHMATGVIREGRNISNLENFKYQNHVYVNDRTSRTLYSCEPIRARYLKNGSIICLACVANGMVDKEVNIKGRFEELGLKENDEYNTNDFFIGQFLNDHFAKDIAAITETKALKAEEQCIVNPPGYIHPTSKLLRIGDMVKIKCEGRTGILKRLDTTKNTATLLVDNKPLTYRLDDLTPEN